MIGRIALILGGARSGKSRRALQLAEQRAQAENSERVYVATAEAGDAEMAERIALHQKERSSAWRTCEAPIELASAITNESAEGNVIVVDCLTLWLSNILLAGRDPDAEVSQLEACFENPRGRIILVSNEVGLGLVPETPLGREFRDQQGRLNQRMAATADLVEFVAAGIPLQLKP